MKTSGFLCAALVVACLVVAPAAPARADTAYASRYIDLSFGLFPSLGINTSKRSWAPGADGPSLRTPVGVFITPSFGLLRGLRFELGIGAFALEPPITFAIQPGFKIFPFHKYSFKAPMTKRKGGKWVPPPPVDGPYVRIAGLFTIGSLAVKDKEDADVDDDKNCPPTNAACPMIDPMGMPITAAGRLDKARAPFIFGGSLGIGYFFRSKGEAPEAPEAPEGAPEAPKMPGAGEGLTDWGGVHGDLPLPPGPEMPAPPEPPKLEEPKAPEPPKPSAVGFDFEIVASILRHTKFETTPAHHLNAMTGVDFLRPIHWDDNNNMSACTHGTDAVNPNGNVVVNPFNTGGIGGAGPNWIADCEQGTWELRFELRIGIEMWLF